MTWLGDLISDPQRQLQMMLELHNWRNGFPSGVSKPKVSESKKDYETFAPVDPGYAFLDRALAAEQQRMAAEKARGAATSQAPRRSYPIDAYGSTPEERIRTVQNLNAAESGGEAITEMAGPHIGMFGYNPEDVAAFQSRSQYEFSPDTGPAYAHADANMAHAANERARMEAIQKQVQEEQAAAAQRQPFTDLINLSKAYEASGDHPAIGAVMERAAVQELERRKQLEQQMQQQMLRQQMQRRPTLPVTGRPLSLLEMIQYGMV